MEDAKAPLTATGPTGSATRADLAASDLNPLNAVGHFIERSYMSINSLANAATARRPDFAPIGTVPKGAAEIAAAANTPPTHPNVIAADGKTPVVPGRVDTTFNVLFGYIPTEVLTLYVAVLAALEGDKFTNVRWTIFIIFLVGTPIIFWLVYAAKLKADGKGLPIALNAWPVWEMFAATVAFCAWAFALPQSPFAAYNWYSPALSSLAVLLVSTLLGLLAPLLQRPLQPS